MREETITYKLFKFAELDENAQEKALEKFWDINVDYPWWEHIYEDAQRIGLKITEFDIDRGSYAEGHLTKSAKEVSELILKNHGDQCETYKTASQFLADSAGMYDENDWEQEDDLAELVHEFELSLLEDYRIMLQKEFDYLTSREAVIETIEANDYEFLEDGTQY